MPLARSPEARLVFRSADPACGTAELVALTRAVEDWDRLVVLADGEMATAALWRALRDAEAPLPAPVASYLRRGAMFGDFRMQQLAQRLGETTAAFGAAGVPVLLLKGAAIAALVDPTFRTRPMSDLDLLVRREDVPRAIAALASAGWQQTSDPAMHELLGAGHHHLPPFLDPRVPGTRVELHVALFSQDHSFAFDESHLWREARPAAAPFASALVPSPEQLLLHACIHFAWQHTMQFGSWRTFRLAAATVRTTGFSWERFVTMARDARALTACYWTLRLAHRMCEIAVPTEILARLSPPTAEFVQAAIERHFIAANVPGEGPQSPSLGLSRLLWRTALRPGWSGHRSPERWQEDDRWDRALRPGQVRESLLARLRRHLTSVRRWRDFVVVTLGGRHDPAGGAR